MLGGAGPAIAAVPLVVVWAGGSTITLIQSVARGKVGALGSASRVGFVVTMSIGQVLATPSRYLPWMTLCVVRAPMQLSRYLFHIGLHAIETLTASLALSLAGALSLVPSGIKRVIQL